jgi:hypothetical protein
VPFAGIGRREDSVVFLREIVEVPLEVRGIGKKGRVA